MSCSVCVGAYVSECHPPLAVCVVVTLPTPSTRQPDQRTRRENVVLTGERDGETVCELADTHADSCKYPKLHVYVCGVNGDGGQALAAEDRCDTEQSNLENVTNTAQQCAHI